MKPSSHDERSGAEPPVRDSGPGEGVWGNPEVPPAEIATPEEAEASAANAKEAADPAPPPTDDSYLRLAAEFDNYRKRVARDQADFARRANERMLSELLPVLDDLERALQAAEEHEEAKLEEGVRLVHRQLADTLRKEGLAEIDTDGVFDPHVHEALLTQPGEGVEPGHVLQVLQKGYRLGDRVLRPARVIVSE